MYPFFYHEALEPSAHLFTLDENTSKHCIQVLRMQEGDKMVLTNGKGGKAVVNIVAADRKRCGVAVLSYEAVAPQPCQLTLAVAFTKNNSRNEWLLEKATEMGIAHIIPIIVQRSEKEKFNAERLKGILVSAMLQSQQYYLPVLSEPIALKKIIPVLSSSTQKFIAHCIDEEQRLPLKEALVPQQDAVILIGPEGDFTSQEIVWCLEQKFIAVSLGQHRLRTETAGLYACTVFNILNYA
jgi:16S rRNA (uracil1498-N3)-methyltransferase